MRRIQLRGAGESITALLRVSMRRPGGLSARERALQLVQPRGKLRQPPLLPVGMAPEHLLLALQFAVSSLLLLNGVTERSQNLTVRFHRWLDLLGRGCQAQP